MSIRIVRLGSPRSEGEGTRIGTVRRPPRGAAGTAGGQRRAGRMSGAANKQERRTGRFTR